MRSRAGSVALACLAMMGALLVPAGAGNAAKAGRAEGTASLPDRRPHPNVTLTRARMRAAKPLPLPTAGRAGLGRSTMVAPRTASSATIPADPGPGAVSWRGLGSNTSIGTRVDASGLIPFTSYEAADYTAVGTRTFGKIFMTWDGQDYWVCSGSAINSANESVMWTAAHCLYTQEEGWVQDLVFAPAYRNGDTPYGTFPLVDAYIPAAYQAAESFGYDLAAVVLGANDRGQTLTDAVGGQGIAWGQDATNTFYEIHGWPGAPEAKFDGEKHIICESPFGGYYQYPSGGYVVAVGCDMEGGASGGGWLNSGSSALDSNVSGGEPGSEIFYGPYFGDEAQLAYTKAASVDPGDGPAPQPSPDPAEDTVHEMALSLALKKHLIASGRLIAADGYVPCTVGAPVGVLRKTSNGWKLLKQTTTGSTGNYRFRLADRPGKYAVISPEGTLQSGGTCTETASVTRVHRH